LPVHKAWHDVELLTLKGPQQAVVCSMASAPCAVLLPLRRCEPTAKLIVVIICSARAAEIDNLRGFCWRFSFCLPFEKSHLYSFFLKKKAS
jgi:hypothetical protein